MSGREVVKIGVSYLLLEEYLASYIIFLNTWIFGFHLNIPAKLNVANCIDAKNCEIVYIRLHEMGIK